MVDLEKNKARQDCSGRASSNLAMQRPHIMAAYYSVGNSPTLLLFAFYKYFSTLGSPRKGRLQGEVVMKRLLSFALMLVPLFSTAAPPSTAAFSACQNGASSGVVKVEPIPFNSITEDDEYWEGWTANTVDFKGRTVGYARKGDAEGIAYAGRVYPLNLARLINVSRAEYVDQVGRGSIGVAPPADWSWLTDKTGARFVCVAINRSMDKGTPMAFFLSTAGRTLFFYQGQD